MKISVDEYEGQLRQKLKDDPSLLLPKANEFVIDKRKYTEYLFGGSNEWGLTKGRLIDAVLGYNLSNYIEFDKKLKNSVKEFPAILKKEIEEMGKIYEVNVVILGLKNRKAIIQISALYDIETSRLVTAYITDIKGVKTNGD